MSDYSDIYPNYRTRFGGRAKPTILTFQYAPIAASQLGATPDGRFAGSLIAQGITPHSASMTSGITAAINSCGKMPFEKFSGGAASMWDLDSALATEPTVEAILRTFIDKNGQIFQGNATPLEELLKARENPEGYEHLFVRVGGYSARFVNLAPALQNDVIQRLRHSH
jgi:formate C-acetyltransferase